MKFTPSKVAFGRHETFLLRYSWLTKGFQKLKENREIFTSSDATVELGVGKNMVNAIRFWLLASKMIQPAKDKGFEATEIGNQILGEYDPYLEDEATLWLVHWLITTNPELATAWYWFFNEFHKPEFVSEEVAIAITEFVLQREIKSAITTVKKDAALVLRMYTPSRNNSRIGLEEVLDSPLSQLGLVSHSIDGHTLSSPPGDREGLPDAILGFAIADLFQHVKESELPIKDLMYSRDGHPSPAAIFRLTENALITKLERLISRIQNVFEIRETAGIHQLYLLKKTDPLFFLKKHYKIHLAEDAA